MIKKLLTLTFFCGTICLPFKVDSADYRRIIAGSKIYEIRCGNVIVTSTPKVFDNLIRFLSKKDVVNKVDRIALAEALSYTKHPRLLAAMAYVESRFDPDAVSPVGARGVFQIHHSSTYVSTGDPIKDVFIADKILEDKIKAHKGNIRKGVAAYCGRGSQARAYSKQVFKILKEV